MNKDFQQAYKVLNKIYVEKCYLNIALNAEKAMVTPLLTRLVYGVVERDTELEYYLSKLIKTNTNIVARIAIKLGIYCLLYLDNTPDYTVVNECVELVAKDINPKLKSLVNATLNKFIEEKISLPREKFAELAVRFSKPEWLVRRYYKQFGEEIANRLLTLEGSDAKEHIRANISKISFKELEKLLDANAVEYRKSKAGGYYVNNCKAIQMFFNEGLFTFQSPSSMLAVQAMPKIDEGIILDACASPGGKSVYLSELNAKAVIHACDIHEHRITLINKYASRMGAERIVSFISDATVNNAEMNNKYSAVLCDVPCSGMGVLGKKPDILLNTTYQDVLDLSEHQYNILNNVINYCIDGGVVLYSTCSTMREENENVIARILKNRSDVELQVMDIPFDNNGCVQILPSDDFDGFFIAKLRKKI